MKDDAINAELTAALRDFLNRRGYTHIASLGIEPKEVNDAAEPETPKENYWLEPVKPGDPGFSEQHQGHILLETTGADVTAMVNGTDDIQYMIRVPLVDYNDYLAKR